MERADSVFAEAKKLYSTAPDIGKWFWNNHVQQVADRARTLAEKYDADAEKAYCAALLHDLGDCHFSGRGEGFVAWSEQKGKEVLLGAGFSEDDAREVVEVIIRPHSCRDGKLPTTIEGKVLATADAMWHLETSLYPMFCYKQMPQRTKTYEEWQEWFLEKAKRDFSIKIFFEDERAEVKENYEALLRVFGNKTLDSKEG
jgi:HD superfamily phosphodiesterase